MRADRTTGHVGITKGITRAPGRLANSFCAFDLRDREGVLEEKLQRKTHRYTQGDTSRRSDRICPAQCDLATRTVSPRLPASTSVRASGDHKRDHTMTDRTPYWTLDDDGNPQPCDDVLEWGLWFEKNLHNRHVSEDMDEGEGAEQVRVSTVFLALDHSWHDGPPILYETLVFGGVLDGEMARYSTRQDAAIGHQVMCQRVREAQKLGRRDDDGT